MRITSARPCSRRSHGRSGWRSNPIRVPAAGSRPRRANSRPLPVALAVRPITHGSLMTTIAVIDYGMGNLRSVSKALEHVAPGARVEVTSDPAIVAAADRVVFPGQGAMPDCMREMEACGLRPAVLAAANSRPFLGICIGLHILFDSSDGGGVRGLAVLS